MTLAPLALLLPLSSFVLLAGLITIHRPRLSMSRLSVRGAVVVAFVAFEAGLLAITEGLSLGHWLTTGPTTAAWGVVTVGTALAFHLSGGTARGAAWIRGGGAGRAWGVATSSPWVGAGIGILVVIGLVLVAMALLYLPNNADSLVYHLARVAHWEQAGSVEHYATHSLAQLELAPLHEFNMLHLHVLAGTDSFDGFVQLLAFVVCILGASEIARLLGASREVQLGAAVITAVAPSALLEATSTQNNLFAAAIGVAAVVIVLGWEAGGRVVPPAIALGLTVGLAIVAKGTLGLLIAPLLLLLAVRIALDEARQSSWGAVLRRAAGTGALVALCAVVMAGPFLQRNLDLFDGVGGPVTDTTRNQEVSARASAANVVRSVAVNFRIGDGGNDPESLLSRVGLDALEEVDSWIKAPAYDPSFVIGGPIDTYAHDDFTELERTEEYGANGWHVVLMVVTLGALGIACLRGDRRARLPLAMGVALALGFVVFSALTRWSLYVTRYSLPLLLLWAPLIAIALAGIHRVVLRLSVALLVIAAVPLLLGNTARPLPDRLDFENDIAAYFAPQLEGSFLVVATPTEQAELLDAIVATGCERVALGNLVTFEYPLWAGLDNRGWHGEIRAVDVTNPSGVLEHDDFEPCATIRTGSPDGPSIDGQTVFEFGGLTLSVDDDLVDRLPESVSSST